MSAHELLYILLCTAPALAWGGEVPAVWLACLLAGMALAVVGSARPARPAPAVGTLLALALLLAVVSTARGITPLASTWTLSWWLMLALLWRHIQGQLEGFSALTRLLAAAALMGTVVAAMGLVDTLLRPLPFLGPRPYRGQVSGPFVNPSHMVSHLLLAFPATLVLALAARSTPVRWTFRIATLVQLAAIVLSFSRGGWLGTAVALLALAAGGRGERHGRQLLAILLLLAAGAGVRVALKPSMISQLVGRLSTISPRSDQAVNYFGRLGPWSVAVELIRERPVTGWGPGAFPAAFYSRRPPGYYYRPSHAHCELLEFGVELGVAGVVGSLILLLMHAQLGQKALQRAPDELERLLVVAVLSGGFGLIATSLWDWPLRVPATALLAAGLAGALAGAAGDASETSPGRPLLWCLLLAVPLGLVAGRLKCELVAGKARALASTGRREEAVRLLETCRRSWPSVASFAQDEVDLLGPLLMNPATRSTWTKISVEAALTVAAAQAHDPDAFCTLGRTLATAGLLDLAMESYQMAITLDTTHHQPYLEKGNILYAAGRRTAALAAYRACLERYPVERIGELPEIATQLLPVSIALQSKDTKSLEMAVELLELRKARARGDFRPYRMLAEVYRRHDLPAQADAEQEEERNAARVTASEPAGSSRPQR